MKVHDTIDVRHIRVSSGKDKHGRPAMHPRGGITVATKRVADTLYVGVSVCSPVDTFERRGWHRAVGRLTQILMSPIERHDWATVIGNGVSQESQMTMAIAFATKCFRRVLERNFISRELAEFAHVRVTPKLVLTPRARVGQAAGAD